jgi:Nitrogen regulatory protein P-II
VEKSVPVKIVMLIFRDSLDDDIRNLLKEFGVKAFTEMHNVTGLGETGAAFHSFAWPGCNSMILAAMPEKDADRLIKGVREFRDRRVHHQHGLKLPLRAFVLSGLESV